MAVGTEVGKKEMLGCAVGSFEGWWLGLAVGLRVGDIVGSIVGDALGSSVGAGVGSFVGLTDLVGCTLGIIVGLTLTSGVTDSTLTKDKSARVNKVRHKAIIVIGCPYSEQYSYRKVRPSSQ